MATSLDLTPLNVHALLRAHNVQPKKSLGQNFLVDPSALERIVEAADIPPGAEVLEVGPGLGSLTRHLAAAARRVTAVELDARLLPALEEVLAGWENVTIVQGDILELNPAELMTQPEYLVVANIPYYITSALIRHLLEAEKKPSRIVLTVQREVAERITAGPGDLSLLALSVQVYGAARRSVRIPAGAFFPVPKVDSDAVRIDLYPRPLVPPDQINQFFRLTKAGFSQKRKTLRNSLSASLRLSTADTEVMLRRAGIDPMRRAETVSIEEWRALVDVYAEGQE